MSSKQAAEQQAYQLRYALLGSSAMASPNGRPLHPKFKHFDSLKVCRAHNVYACQRCAQVHGVPIRTEGKWWKVRTGSQEETIQKLSEAFRANENLDRADERMPGIWEGIWRDIKAAFGRRHRGLADI